MVAEVAAGLQMAMKLSWFSMAEIVEVALGSSN